MKYINLNLWLLNLNSLQINLIYWFIIVHNRKIAENLNISLKREEFLVLFAS